MLGVKRKMNSRGERNETFIREQMQEVGKEQRAENLYQAQTSKYLDVVLNKVFQNC